jgi:soluble lytic murein transglycosylase-like protein
MNYFPSPPGDTLKRGGVESGGGTKIMRFLMRSLGGIFVGLLLISQSLTVKANSLSYQPQYEDNIPEEIRIYCELVGYEYNICPELLEAMAYRESRFMPTVQSGNQYGLMQINVQVHKNRIAKYGWNEQDMLDPYKNLMVAGDYLSELYETYGDDNPIVLNAYNGNWKAINKYKEYGYLSEYVEDVLDRSMNYERLHGK